MSNARHNDNRELYVKMMWHDDIQSNPKVTDPKGLKFFFFYGWTSAIANILNKEKLIHGTKKSFRLKVELGYYRVR